MLRSVGAHPAESGTGGIEAAPSRNRMRPGKRGRSRRKRMGENPERCEKKRRRSAFKLPASGRYKGHALPIITLNRVPDAIAASVGFRSGCQEAVGQASGRIANLPRAPALTPGCDRDRRRSVQWVGGASFL